MPQPLLPSASNASRRNKRVGKNDDIYKRKTKKVRGQKKDNVDNHEEEEEETMMDKLNEQQVSMIRDVTISKSESTFHC